MSYRVHWNGPRGPKSAWAEDEIDARILSRQLKAAGCFNIVTMEATPLDEQQRVYGYKAEWPTTDEVDLDNG